MLLQQTSCHRISTSVEVSEFGASLTSKTAVQTGGNNSTQGHATPINLQICWRKFTQYTTDRIWYVFVFLTWYYLNLPLLLPSWATEHIEQDMKTTTVCGLMSLHVHARISPSLTGDFLQLQLWFCYKYEQNWKQFCNLQCFHYIRSTVKSHTQISLFTQ